MHRHVCELARSRVQLQLQPTDGCTHPCSSDLELIHGEVSCRHTGNLTEARPRKSRRKREDGQKRGGRGHSRRRRGREKEGEKKREIETKKEERAKRESPTTRNSYTHPVCGWRKLIQTRSFPEVRFRPVTRATLGFLRSSYARFEDPDDARLHYYLPIINTNESVVFARRHSAK